MQRVDEARLVSQEAADRSRDRAFELPRRQAPAAVSRTGLVYQTLRYVVAIPAALLVGMGRAKPIAGLVVDQPGQEARRLGIGRGTSRRDIAIQLPSDSVEGRPLDDGIVLAWISDALMGDFPDLDRVVEQLVQMPS